MTYAAAGRVSQELGVGCLLGYKLCVQKLMSNNHVTARQPVSIGTSMFQALAKVEKEMSCYTEYCSLFFLTTPTFFTRKWNIYIHITKIHKSIYTHFHTTTFLISIKLFNCYIYPCELFQVEIKFAFSFPYQIWTTVTLHIVNKLHLLSWYLLPMFVLL